MERKTYKRNELNIDHTWNIYSIFSNEAAYEKALEKLKEQVETFHLTYVTQLNEPKMINKALDELRVIQQLITKTSAFQSLQMSTDSTNLDNQVRSGKYQIFIQEVVEKLSFVTNELNAQNVDVLKEAQKENKENSLYLQEIIDNSKHKLSKEVEETIIAFSPTLNAAYTNYQRFKFIDMKFSDFEVNGKKYANSFTLFENEWEYEPNTDIRRKAYESFYETLSNYQNGFASNYYAHIQKEKTIANLKGFDSVIDYLLWNQKVPRSFMDRQIDLITTKLGPVMRKYATLLKEIHGLDKITYADLKIAIDPEYEPKVTIEESKSYLLEGLSILGDDYLNLVKRSFDERWIDFPQNIGKSTGGFCSSPYGENSFILLNWNGQMDEVMVLAHELGHAGHFQYANQAQNIYNTRPSLYFIEAPSTTNELIMTRHLLNKADNPRLKRWILSVMISRTYYHNFVTHLLEAAFQREIYQKIDDKKPINAKVLNETKIKVLKDFWQDTVEIPEYAGMTWMRQPHYFMGLYPYTYSAGLTIGTEVSRKIFEKTLDPNDWIEVLKAGGTKTPEQLAKMVNVDITTDQALKNTIEFIEKAVLEIEALTKEINQK